MNSTKQKIKHRLNNKEGKENVNSIDARDDCGHGDSETASSNISYSSPIDLMTSKDFQMDTNAHVEMIYEHLKDSVRVQKFKDAILHNQHLFKGKIVLEIGCGVGLYSLFAAKAGAAKVYAVDSSNVVYYARQIVADNGYSDVIEVLKGKIQDITLPVNEVDIIISDWASYALLFQSICEAVIYARDKWLKKRGGLIFPDRAKLYLAAVEDGKHKKENIDWWIGVYGFNMKCLREVALKEARFQLIKPEQVLSKHCPIMTLDLNTATRDDLRVRSKYTLPMQRTGILDGLALYFHVYFTKSHTPLGFSTDPWSTGTNWMQTVLFLDQSLFAHVDSIYYGEIEMFSNKTPLNFNDMIVNLEMYVGDPEEPDVDVEMSWNLKSATNRPEEVKMVDDNYTTAANTSKSQRLYNAIVEQGLMPTKHAPPITVQSSARSSNYDVGSRTITLGADKILYLKKRRYKNKQNKNG